VARGGAVVTVEHADTIPAPAPRRSLVVVIAADGTDPDHVVEGLDAVHGGMLALRIALDRCRCRACTASRGLS
jgi:hypothetical protein